VQRGEGEREGKVYIGEGGKEKGGDGKGTEGTSVCIFYIFEKTTQSIHCCSVL